MKIQQLRQLLAFIAVMAAMNVVAMPPMAMQTAHAAAVPPMPLAPPKGVRVEAAWVRAAPPAATMLAGYMILRNEGNAPVIFKSAQSELFDSIELHKSVIVNGVSTMRPVGDQAIPAGGTLRIVPGGLHLMLMAPKRQLNVGDQVRFRLHFTDGTALSVDAVVSAEAPAATTR